MLSTMTGREFRAVFLSVVRTRHLAEQSPTLKTDNSECDGDNSDFGFLSDQNLLNTALTRAQSMVAVVGDPVALCAIGECMNVWRTFLKHCQNMESIHPGNVTLERVKGEVSGNNSQPLEVVGRGSETQLQVSENYISRYYISANILSFQNLLSSIITALSTKKLYVRDLNFFVGKVKLIYFFSYRIDQPFQPKCYNSVVKWT